MSVNYEKPQNESFELFTEEFSKSFKEIEKNLDEVNIIDKEKISNYINEIVKKLETLEQSYTDSISFLPNFIKKSSQEKLKILHDTLELKKAEYVPKKKFGFNKKAILKNQQKTKKSLTETSEKIENINLKDLCSKDTLNICDIENSEIIKGREEISGKDILISGIKNTHIKLEGSPGFVSITNVLSCNIFIGPVRGSVLVEQCHNCNLQLACQQLRIHRTSESSFYVYVTSRSIVEECSKVGFAPFNWSYSEIKNDFKSTKLDELNNNWNDVVDFDWLVADKPSPNWFIIPQNQRTSQENNV